MTRGLTTMVGRAEAAVASHARACGGCGQTWNIEMEVANAAIRACKPDAQFLVISSQDSPLLCPRCFDHGSGVDYVGPAIRLTKAIRRPNGEIGFVHSMFVVNFEEVMRSRRLCCGVARGPTARREIERRVLRGRRAAERYAAAIVLGVKNEGRFSTVVDTLGPDEGDEWPSMVDDTWWCTDSAPSPLLLAHARRVARQRLLRELHANVTTRRALIESSEELPVVATRVRVVPPGVGHPWQTIGGRLVGQEVWRTAMRSSGDL